jgi:hypothetical protein
MNFQCTWDSTVITSTVTALIILLLVGVMLFIKAAHYRKNEEKLYAWGCLLGVGLCIVVLFFPALYTPLNVSVKDESIQIHRIKSDIIIPFKDIAEIRRCIDSDTKNAIRAFGSGGAYGYLGKFRSPELGNYQMYATDASKKILVENEQGEYLIFSCDKPDELIGIVNESRIKN